MQNKTNFVTNHNKCHRTFRMSFDESFMKIRKKYQYLWHVQKTLNPNYDPLPIASIHHTTVLPRLSGRVGHRVRIIENGWIIKVTHFNVFWALKSRMRRFERRGTILRPIFRHCPRKDTSPRNPGGTY